MSLPGRVATTNAPCGVCSDVMQGHIVAEAGTLYQSVGTVGPSGVALTLQQKPHAVRQGHGFQFVAPHEVELGLRHAWKPHGLEFR